MNSETFNGRELDGFEGMISAAEAELLYRYASMLGAGCIVEVGSWRGKSAIALARGAKANSAKQPMVYCIEPHAEFVGVYGGVFGSADRAAFYSAMLRAGCARDVALINLPSAAAAAIWATPVGLLFIDGDHNEQSVWADVRAWSGFVVDGGFVAFDDAIDPAVGPAQVIAALLDDRKYRHVETVGKIILLQKKPDERRQQRWRARQDSLNDIRARVVAAGLDEDYALSRLEYGSFASQNHKYLYIETPKAACTSWKRMIVEVEGARFDEEARPYHRETQRDMLIHQRRLVHMPTLIDLDEAERAEIFERREWFTFALTRNPFSRIVSVFDNKVRTGEPAYEALEARFGDRAGFETPKEAFAAFVREVVAVAECRQGDAHLRAQVELLMPRLIPYTQIFKLEDGDAALTAFSGHLHAHGVQRKILLQRYNLTDGRDWRDYYDESTADLISQAYADDFQTFAYDRAGWRGGREMGPVPPAERRWRAQVVERNAMIARLYDELERALNS